MKKIKLTQNKYALVDDNDFIYLNKFKWHINCDDNRYYAIRHNGYINGKRTSIAMHREILNLTDPKIQVDHKDHNGLNNQKNNLRIATNQQNHFNLTKRKDNKSGYKGITWHKRDKIWQSQIQINNKLIYLGSFNNKIDAAKAYDVAAIKYFREFANLNFPKKFLNKRIKNAKK